MNSTDPIHCPECGQPVPVASQHRVCPACLLRQALDSGTFSADNPSPAPTPSPAEIADKFPQFEITQCLGRGGMGVVYKARQKSLDRWVAIKILPPERVGEEKFAERFAREAATLAKLSHPNIVTIHDFGETGGLFYIVMEYVDGVNLRDLLREGKLDPQQALAIVPPICEALQFAHDKGIVHRDIKPENLLLDRDGRLKIADFGIAGLIGAGGESIGTPPYMAPEQAGAATGIDHRADIYALGVVLYEMLTGERPAKELVAPSKKVQLDVRLDEIVLRALEKEPELRYQTAGEFKTMVETMQQPAPPPTPVKPAQNRGMFRRWWWMLLVMIPVGMLLGLAVGGLWNAIPKTDGARAVCEFIPRDGKPRDDALSVEILDGIISREQLMKVGRLLELGSRWQLADVEVPLVLQQLIQVNFIHDTNFLVIRVRSTKPDACCEIANALATTYVPPTTTTLIVRDQATLVTKRGLPNDPLILAISAAAGIPLGLLLALPLMALLQRFFPQRAAATNDPAIPPSHRLANPESPERRHHGDQVAAVAKPRPSLVPTVILHGVLFAIVAPLFVLVVPHFATMFRDWEMELPGITRLVLAPPLNWVVLGLPILLGLDVGCCFLARELGGRRGLIWWTVGVILGLALVVAATIWAIMIPVVKMVEVLGSEASTQFQQEQQPRHPAPPPAAERDPESSGP